MLATSSMASNLVGVQITLGCTMFESNNVTSHDRSSIVRVVIVSVRSLELPPIIIVTSTKACDLLLTRTTRVFDVVRMETMVGRNVSELDRYTVDDVGAYIPVPVGHACSACN